MLILGTFSFFINYYKSQECHNRGEVRITVPEDIKSYGKHPCTICLDKVKHFIMFYSRTVAESIDFVKDITYASTVQHPNFGYSFFLWVSCLFAFVYTAASVLLMPQSLYREQYGNEDFGNTNLWFLAKIKIDISMLTTQKQELLKFSWIKVKRIFKETFYLYSEKELGVLEVR